MNIYKSAAQAVGFYDTPLCREGEIKKEYHDLFKWGSSNGGLFPNNKAGSLKEEMFDTLEKKILYIQGVFEDYSGAPLLLGKNEICFANSSQKVERVKKWINEIAKEKVHGIWGNGVLKHTIEYLIPICHTLTINKEVIEFIQNYRPEK